MPLFIENIVNLKYYHEYCSAGFKNMEKTNDFDYKIYLDKYIDILTNMPYDIALLDGQQYKHTFNISHKNMFFTITWSIDCLTSLVSSDNQIKPMLVSVNSLENIISKHISDYYFSANIQPIIIAAVPQCNCHVVLDGNHRLFSYYKSNQENIPYYLLAPYQHVTAITSNYSKTLFKITYNLFLIQLYISNQISSAVFKYSMFDI